jgi:hypothetical protein
VVQRAKTAAAETSGATSGAKVAAYLRGEGEQGRPSTEKMLERFTMPQPEAHAEVKAPAQTALRSEKLESLAKAAEPVAPATPSTEVLKGKSEEELARANEKLASLLGKPGSK